MKNIILRFLARIWYVGFCESGVGGELEYLKNVIDNQLEGRVREMVKTSTGEFRKKEEEQTSEKEIKNKVWMEKYEQICAALADFEFSYELIKDKEDNEIVGQKDVGKFGSTVGKTNITAKEGKEQLLDEITKKKYVKECLEKLMEL